MMKRQQQRGSLWAHVSIIVFCTFSVCATIATLITGNMWVEIDSITKEYSKSYGGEVRVIYLERHIWTGSRVVLEHANGKRVLYEIDSDLLFRYSFDRKD